MHNKKKLLIFHPTIAPYRIDFFNDLSQAFNTRICLRYKNLRSQTFDYEKIIKKFRFTPIYLKEALKIGKRTFPKGIWKHLDEFSPEIVIVEEFSYGTILVLFHRFIKKRKYKIVSICDDSYNMVAENNDFSLAHKLLRRFVTPKLDSILLVELKVREWYIQNYNKGFYFPIIKSEESTRQEYERLLPLSKETIDKYKLSNKNVFLFVGRLVTIKNVETAIRAFSKLNQQENTFIIIGDGPERGKLEQLSKELSTNILFLGRLEGDFLNIWYNIANIFILPSILEPFGAVTNEALLAGCYAIVSNKAGSSCLIKNDINGCLFNPQNIEELSEKMKSLSKLTKSTSSNILRPNKMLLRYQDKMNELITHLENL